jgi:DNA ligase-1
VSGATLLEFAQVNDAAAATTKKLQKYAILAEYFRRLADDDLRLAVRFAAGRTFAATDERVTAVGGAIVSDVILRLLRVDPQEYYDTVVASGEIGEALSKLWSRRADANADVNVNSNADAHADADGRPLAVSRTSSLTLHDLCRAFEDLAATGHVQRKSETLTDIFSRCADPREAAYLAKIIFGDLRTGVQEGVLHYAIAEAFARDGKAVQRAQLLVGDLGEVAVLAKHDRLADAQFKLFHPIQFMLATPQETAHDAAETMGGRAFFAEDKLDGIRAQVHKQGDGAAARVAIYTRTMDRTDASFPDVVDALRRLPGDFLLDGEIVPFRDGRVLPFAHIQKRLGRKVPTPKIIRDNPCAFIAFDILYRDGALLMDHPLRERRAALELLTTPTGNGSPAAPPRVLLPERDETPAERTRGGAAGLPRAAEPFMLITAVTPVTTAEEIDASFCNARDCRNEGLILKDPESPYSPGRRGQMWLKLKTHLPTFDCVVTFAETGHGKRRNSLSDYTFGVWDREPNEPGAQLVNVGKAYSGVTDAEIAQLTEIFTNDTVQQWGRVRQVVPKIVLEIACDQIQKSARHASGYALRFPRIKRIRWDKPIAEADRLSRVIEVYESVANFGRSDAAAEPVETPEPTLFDGLA